jgi:cyclin D1/2/4
VIILQVYTYYSFRPLTAYLAVNYLDRFLSRYELPVRISQKTFLVTLPMLSISSNFLIQ